MMHIQHASIGYTKALYSVNNLQILPGEILCVLGENGCGKSTLLQTMSGFMPCIDGVIELPPNSRVAFLGSKSANHPQLKVKQALLLAFNRDKAWYKSYSSEQENACDDLLKRFQMFELKDAYINELSDGQMQKLWLGQSLLSNPDILFLDEPTGHLDANNSAFIFQELHHWVKTEQKTVVLTSHKIDWILQIAHKVLLISDGKSTCYTANDEALIAELNRCFAGKYHSVDFHNKQYLLNLTK